MITDNIMVALIRESVTAESRPRRAAARLILDDIRSNPQFTLTRAKAEVVRADAGADVAAEMYALVTRFGLLDPDE